jgi:hypothetical protein
MESKFIKFISRVLMLSVLCLSIWTPVAQAALITSEQLAVSQTAQNNRERVREFFDRADVQAQLQARGISADSAKSRVDMMTDSEIASINGHLDNLPAGGMDILGFFLLIFIILLITDILGLTHVFNFVRHR